jgi:hypothetical protein
LLDIVRKPLRFLFTGISVLAFASLLLFAPATDAGVAELIMLEEDGCPWCEQWREDIGGIYPVTDEGKIAPLRVVNIHDPLPKDLSFLVKGGYTPTFVLVDKGKEIGRIRGYPGESFFWGLLSVIIEKLPKADKSST